MCEIWRDIPGYEGIYQASSEGRIRGIDGRKTTSLRHGDRCWKERVLKPKGCADFRKIGYRVSLWKDKKPRDFLVARLVACTFLGNLIETKMTVNHKDGNRLNNHIENLEWLTLGDNIRHGFATGLYRQNKIILMDMASGIVKQYRSYSQAGQSIGRSHGYISNCIKTGAEINGANGRRYTIKE